MPRRHPDEERTQRKPKTMVRIKKECSICADQATIDYKQPDLLKRFMTERGKILPRKYTGNCARHQRQMTTAIKRARVVLLVR